MSNKCFVPNCNSTSGIQFPKDFAVRKKWLNSLNLAELTPKPSSFVCFSHFKQSDLNEETISSTRLSNKLKKGAVPCIVITEDVKAPPEICRVCMSNKNVEKNIFDNLEGEFSITSSLMVCAFPLEISKNDGLPTRICKHCLHILRVAHKFRIKCLDTDEILRDKLMAQQESLSFEPENVKGSPGDVQESIVTLSNIKIERLSKAVGENSKEIKQISIITSQVDKTRKVARKRKSVDDIEKGMEQIHGMENVKSSLIKEEQRSVEEILETLEGSTTKRPRPGALIKKTLAASDIKLPKDIQIKPVKTHESSVGTFPCELRNFIYDSTFVFGGEYVFEFGLLKGDIRQLRCVISTCNSVGEQRLLLNGTYDSFITVKVPHNHLPPNAQQKKKQMFSQVMRKKIQTDRSLNIRNVYEEVCIQDPEMEELVPLKNIINEICRHQLAQKIPKVCSFEEFFETIERDAYHKLHFTHNNKQFYQEKFSCDDGSKAILFGNCTIIAQISTSKVMYVDASFKIDTNEDFKYQLVTILVWMDDSYYPILFLLINKKSQDLFKKVFTYLHDVMSPNLRPIEIITDFEANLYYALAEVYIDSNIGGSVFYYTQNLYKKICSLNLSRDLETNSYFRNIYHMLLMLPLLPVNTILDGLNNVEMEARNLNISDLARPLFDHVRNQWIINVTPELFCVHKLENRINENVIAPFKKLRDFVLLSKGKMQRANVTITHVIDKLIELESFLRGTYSRPDKKSFGRDLSSFQKKNVLRAWQYIEDHPKIEINSFFAKVVGYLKCMENQLWIWGFYRYEGDSDDVLINASHFSIVSGTEEEEDELIAAIGDTELVFSENSEHAVVMEAVIDQDGEIILQTQEHLEECEPTEHFENAFLKYVYQDYCK